MGIPYDGLGRAVIQIRNEVSGSTVPDTNVTTTTSYDALGRMPSTQDPSLAITRQQYDGLGRTTVITDSLNRVTQVGYDGQGQQRWTMTPDGRVAVVLPDGLGRRVATIQHYQDGVSTAAEVDQDLISRTVYDWAGRVFQQSDAGGQVDSSCRFMDDSNARSRSFGLLIARAQSGIWPKHNHLSGIKIWTSEQLQSLLITVG